MNNKEIYPLLVDLDNNKIEDDNNYNNKYTNEDNKKIYSKSYIYKTFFQIGLGICSVLYIIMIIICIGWIILSTIDYCFIFGDKGDETATFWIVPNRLGIPLQSVPKGLFITAIVRTILNMFSFFVLWLPLILFIIVSMMYIIAYMFLIIDGILKKTTDLWLYFQKTN